MAKSSKQKDKQGKNIEKHSQQQQPKVPKIAPNPQVTAAELLKSAAAEATATLDVTSETEVTVEAESLLVTKPTATQELQAALQAKPKQAKQWKQQLKAGKMVGAQVQKRFNRGG